MPRTVIDKDRSVLSVINESHVTREQQEQVVRRFPPPMSDVVSKVPALVDEETAAKVSAVISEYGVDRRVYEIVFQVWGSSNAGGRHA